MDNLDEFWAKELTKFEISEGNLKSISDCNKFYKSLFKPDLDKRFDIDLPDIKNKILEIIPELIDQLGRKPNYHQIANELEIKKDLTAEILEAMISEGSIEKIKVGKGYNYCLPGGSKSNTGNNINDEFSNLKISKDLINMPLEEKERLISSYVTEIGLDDSAPAFNPYPKNNADLGKIASGKSNLGDKEDEIKRMMEALKLSPGQKMELSLKFKNQPATLRDYLERQIMLQED